jgi:drug/metabolite transporter (DMT)-like permease
VGPLLVAMTVGFTVYSQLILRWQVQRVGDLGDTTGDRIHFFARLLSSPWMWTVFLGAGVAAVSWMAALTRYELSVIYPFIALSFVGVLLGSAVFFGEALNGWKLLGIALVVLGLAVGSRGA